MGGDMAFLITASERGSVKLEGRMGVLGKMTTFKGSDELCSAGDRIELVRFLSTLIH
jgi:hypothetical protein